MIVHSHTAIEKPVQRENGIKQIEHVGSTRKKEHLGADE